MSCELTQLETWAAPLLAALSASERRKLARKIGTELRRSQRQRIAAQQNPDGSAYAPRKRQQKGNIRRRAAAMFRKIRQARFMKVKADPAGVAVGFTGHVARIARVHQYGLRDAPRKGSQRVRYEQRELLGFADADIERIRDLLLDHLAGT